MRSSVLEQRGQAALLVVSGNAVHFICLQSLQMSTFLDFQFYHLNMDIDVELPISIYEMQYRSTIWFNTDGNCSVNTEQSPPGSCGSAKVLLMDVDSLKVIKYKTNFITVLPISLIVGGVQKISFQSSDGWDEGHLFWVRVYFKIQSFHGLWSHAQSLCLVSLLLVPKLKQC